VEKRGIKEYAAFLQATEASRLAEIGNCPAVRAKASASLQHYPDGVNRPRVYIVFALCEEEAKAQIGVDGLAHEYPENALVHCDLLYVVAGGGAHTDSVGCTGGNYYERGGCSGRPALRLQKRSDQLRWRWRMVAICWTSVSRAANSGGVSDCMPSERAFSGW
jgi:hypothetical protein